MSERLTTGRLILRPWRLDDAEAASRVYGRDEVARWLSPAMDPAMDKVRDHHAMRLLLQQWVAEDERTLPPAGRWAIELRAERLVVGGAVLLYLPPGGEDLDMGWHLHPDAWGHGYATEAGQALARWAFDHGADEVFAVVRLRNTRAAATARRIGMEWVGETEKYYDLRLQVFRLRASNMGHPRTA